MKSQKHTASKSLGIVHGHQQPPGVRDSAHKVSCQAGGDREREAPRHAVLPRLPKAGGPRPRRSRLDLVPANGARPVLLEPALDAVRVEDVPAGQLHDLVRRFVLALAHVAPLPVLELPVDGPHAELPEPALGHPPLDDVLVQQLHRLVLIEPGVVRPAGPQEQPPPAPRPKPGPGHRVSPVAAQPPKGREQGRHRVFIATDQPQPPPAAPLPAVARPYAAGWEVGREEGRLHAGLHRNGRLCLLPAHRREARHGQEPAPPTSPAAAVQSPSRHPPGPLVRAATS
eukprot:CAMPEP_0206239510 /NCGR_PEP_ID=MMETSP0047_2-20121206/15424_1 /ASSEMBLY_ACC=CAM_ASM_000192 /TAXON_ID=195065 /ORGANISM="Chroomonas mesostigmatica_cf, Strain CCMP1168" /LENGTH=284 /DNA_ID=CAMNT_0053664191 /DNA_START=63 /DNA_END=915 /DNA_ORIENTATION=+